MKLYTKTGDDGTTGLFGGERVHKDDDRVEAYGAVDELNAWIGLLCTKPRDAAERNKLTGIQSDLFALGAELATPDAEKLPACVTNESIRAIETWIDETETRLPALKSFILPGGSEAAAMCHYARTVCRRAERAVVTLTHREALRPQVVTYLNRLGDLFFALARKANLDAGVTDTPWIAPTKAK